MSNAEDCSKNSLTGSAIPDFSKLLEICINHLNDAVVITEAEPINKPGPRIVWANKVFYERNGYTPEEIIGQSPRILQGPESDRATLDKIRYALEHWQSVRAEILNYCKDGSTYWNEFEIVPIANEQGWYTHWVSVQRNVTERKQASNSLRESEEKLRGLFQLSPLGIALTDMNGRYIEFNDAFQKICGYSKEELNKLDYWAITPDQYKSAEAAQLLSLEQTNHYGPYEKEYIRKDGRLIPILLNGSLITGIDGNKYIWSIVEDISERQSILDELRESEERFRQMFEKNSAVMLLIEPQSGMIVDANPAASAFYGYPLINLKGKEVSSITVQTDEQISPEFKLDIAEERNYSVYDHRLATGEVRTVEVHSSTVSFKNRNLLFAIIHDITDRKIAEEQIRQMAFYDTLTKIPNRRLLIDRLDQTIASSKRNFNFGALMFLDLDNFKPLNDTHGHKLGDLLLIEAAHRIGSCIRQTDTVARFGGDEFVVMLCMLGEDLIASELLAGAIAKNILESLSAPYLLTLADAGKGDVTVEHRCTASIGVTIFKGDSGSREDILKHADAAMYQAKHGGRNRIQLHEKT